jgi:ankyrin repeat protein
LWQRINENAAGQNKRINFSGTFAAFSHNPVEVQGTAKTDNKTMNKLIAILFMTGLVFGRSLAVCGEIHDAAANGDLEKVKALLKTNPDLVFSTNNLGSTPLHALVYQGIHTDSLNAKAPEDRKAMVELLLADKANLEAKDHLGMTPLHWAVAQGQLDMAELLLAHGADVNPKDNAGLTPLHTAAGTGLNEMVKLLLGHGAKINAKDNNSMTPLANLVIGSCAVNKVKPVEAMMELLLAHGADINVRDERESGVGLTLLHQAVLLDNREMAALLLKGKADVNATNSYGETPLYAAVDNARMEMVKLLLANQAAINVTNNDGETPLHEAAKYGHKDIVEFLRQHGGHK